MENLLLLLVSLSGWCWSVHCTRALQQAKRCHDALLTGMRNAEAKATEWKALLTSLLERAHVDSGKLTPKPETVNLQSLIEQVAEEYRPHADARELYLRVLPSRQAVHTETDPLLLRQLIRHLVSNGLKFTQAGGVTLCVRTGMRARLLAVLVTDSGTGLSAKQCAALFADGTTGGGSGLVISRAVARVLGGDITVESTLLMGSTFTVWVPSGPPDLSTASSFRATPCSLHD